MQQVVLAHKACDFLRKVVRRRRIAEHFPDQVGVDEINARHHLLHKLKKGGLPRAVGACYEKQGRARIVRRGQALCECFDQQLVDGLSFWNFVVPFLLGCHCLSFFETWF